MGAHRDATQHASERRLRAAHSNPTRASSGALAVVEGRDVDRPVLLTAAEAAEFLRLRESTLRDYSRRGIVPCVRIGRHVRFIEADLLAWLEEQRPG